MEYRKYWIALVVVLVAAFAVLGSVGYKAITTAPPIANVVTTDGRVLFTGETIRDGQNAWQSIGGQEVGSIFGHGAYVAPDWTADWLHRESVYILDQWAKETGVANYASASVELKASLQARLQELMRTNTYNAATNSIVIPPVRAAAFEELEKHYADTFGNGRSEYAIPQGALTDSKKLHDMSAFFFWTSWAASTNRPGEAISYTQNWPHEELVGNRPTGNAIAWSVISVILLLAGIGGMVWYLASKKHEPMNEELPTRDPLLGLNPTPSQRATI